VVKEKILSNSVKGQQKEGNLEIDSF